MHRLRLHFNPACREPRHGGRGEGTLVLTRTLPAAPSRPMKALHGCGMNGRGSLLGDLTHLLLCGPLRLRTLRVHTPVGLAPETRPSTARAAHLPLQALGDSSHGLFTSSQKCLQLPRQGPRSLILEANPGSVPPSLHLSLCLCHSVLLSLSRTHTHTHTPFSHHGITPLAW